MSAQSLGLMVPSTPMALVPVVPRPHHLSVQFEPPPLPRPPVNEVVCLAQTLYYEAGGEPPEGLEAVAATVFNRVSSPSWPGTICRVVYQHAQFSWTLDRATWQTRPRARFLDLAVTFLQRRAILQDMYPVTHFHHVDITPRWAPTLTYVGTFGLHHFYGGPS